MPDAFRWYRVEEDADEDGVIIVRMCGEERPDDA